MSTQARAACEIASRIISAVFQAAERLDTYQPGWTAADGSERWLLDEIAGDLKDGNVSLSLAEKLVEILEDGA